MAKTLLVLYCHLRQCHHSEISLVQMTNYCVNSPHKYIAVIVRPDEMMSFGGSTEPCAMVDFISAGKIGGEENKNYSKAIAALMEKLGVPSDRYVNKGFNETLKAQRSKGGVDRRLD